MAKKKKGGATGGEGTRDPLRIRAEWALRQSRADVSGMGAEEVQALVHELQIHQVELQIQNEELRRAQMDLAESLDRYADLYEFAPVAYVTLDMGGRIGEANLAAALLLGVSRSELVGSKITDYIDRDCQGRYFQHRRSVEADRVKQACELEMCAAGGARLSVSMESIACGAGERRLCQSALVDVTARRRSEEALRTLNIDLEKVNHDSTGLLERSVERLRLLMAAVEHLGEGVLITGDGLDWPEPKIVFVNGAMCRISGYSAEELIGKTPRIFQGKQSDREVLARMKAELTRQGSCVAELINYRKDGTPYHAELFITPLFDGAGHRTHFVSIHRDITERKDAEAALRERKERLRAVLNATVDAIVTIDRGGTMVDVNPAAGRMFGYRGTEMVGQNVSMLMPMPYRKEHDGYLAAYLETGIARVMGTGREVVARRKDGSTFPVELSVGEIKSLGLFTGIVRDITGRKWAEETLKMEHRFNESLIQSAKSVVLVLDPSGRVVLYNPAFEGLSGRDLEASEGCDWYETFLPRRVRKHVRELFGRVVRGGRIDGAIEPILTKTGEERRVEWYGVPLTDADGGSIGLLLTGTDVTARLQLEQEVYKAAYEEKTRIARDLHDSLGGLLSGTAMLAGVLGRKLRAGKAVDPAEADTIAEQVREAITQARALCYGLQPIQDEPGALAAGLGDLAKRVRASGEWKCKFEMPDGPVEMADPTVANHLFWIAQEAVHNAIRHSGGNYLTVCLRKKDDGRVVLRIKDNGRGGEWEGAARRGGLGLSTMEYRARAIGAELTVSGSGKLGTVVECVLGRRVDFGPAGGEVP